MSIKNKIVVSTLSLFTCFTLYYFFVYNVYRGEINTQASYISHDTAIELTNSAELILIGTPIHEFKDREHVVKNYTSGAIQDFYTVTDIKVEKILKGEWDLNSPLPVIEPVAYIQRIDGQRKITTDHYIEMKKDTKYLVTLAKNTSGNYSIINMQNGVFNLNVEGESLSERKNTSDKNSSKHEKIRHDLINMFSITP
ncbi:hypothetical protein [Paenibacillus taiwanensis]|uniref:hypothetical protein n=1 Tax=Paenibacillus taiwanensis TaxID=401638 RepID=UPI0003FE42BB|nr:hypothetical protein [Paenibacillus taiwanensis]